MSSQEDGDLNSIPSEVEQRPVERITVLNSIWDDDQHISKSSTGPPRMDCRWCGSSFAGHNARKMLEHLTEGSRNIKRCAKVTDPHYKRLYTALLGRKKEEQSEMNQVSAEMEAAREQNDSLLAEAFNNHKKRKTQVNSVSRRFSAGGSLSSDQSSLLPVQAARAASARQSTLQAAFRQNPDQDNESLLTMKINDLTHSLGLQFSLGSDPKFIEVIRLARFVPPTYTPPTRKQIGGPLLKIQYDMLISQADASLQANAKDFGLTLYGDGATVRKTPLMNILVACCEDIYTLDIVNCSNQLADGGKKDAVYISQIFSPHMERLDPAKDKVDLLFFDGASNVQKGGKILEAMYPRVHVLHGIEHVVSLFFKDVFLIPIFSCMIDLTRAVYNVFGSGTYHAPHAIFRKKSKAIFGRYLGFIRAADTRMAGYAVSLQRMVRLKEVLKSVLNSREFKNLGLFSSLAELLLKDKLWDQIEFLNMVFEPALRLLRLADSNQPAMDKVYHYVLKVDALLTHNTNRMNRFLSSKSCQREGVTSTCIEHACNNLTRKTHATYIPPTPESYIPKPEDLSSDDGSSVAVADKEDLDYLCDMDDEDSSVSSNSVSGTPLANVGVRRTKPKKSRASAVHVTTPNARAGMQPTEAETGMQPPVEMITTKPRAQGLGLQVLDKWNNRRQKIVSDFAIAGWMLSPIPEIQEQVRSMECADHRMCLERVVVKMFKPDMETDEEMDSLVHDFWKEYQDFRDHVGIYDPKSRRSLWNNSALTDGRSHSWHQMYSLVYTKVLGRVACRVTSKILGIGSAERNWSDVKYILDSKRVNLSPEKLKMQTTIYGAYCAKKAKGRRIRAQRKELSVGSFVRIGRFWSDDDFLHRETGRRVPLLSKRVVKCFLEEWESGCVKREDPVNQVKIQEKYKGLEWWDETMAKQYTAEAEVVWKKGHRGQAIPSGYRVVGCANDGKKHEYPLTANCILHELIHKFYASKTDGGIIVQQRPVAVAVQQPPVAVGAADDASDGNDDLVVPFSLPAVPQGVGQDSSDDSTISSNEK
jgi:hypothetical protein